MNKERVELSEKRRALLHDMEAQWASITRAVGGKSPEFTTAFAEFIVGYITKADINEVNRMISHYTRVWGVKFKIDESLYKDG